MARAFTIVGLGELLWDMLPQGKHLGGAPTNFAYISSRLGNLGVVASRVGNDDLGREAVRQLQQFGLETSHVQPDSEHPTGTVRVHLDRGGQPRFTIHKNVAWDFLHWTAGWKKLANEADAVCFGTLAQRSSCSRATITQFLRTTPAIRVFDVNLRQNFYDAETVRHSLGLATIVKMNHDELPVVLKLLGLKPCIGEAGARCLFPFGPKIVCVTRGRRGSLLMTQNRTTKHPGFSVRLKDTIGAGDAFTAALVHEYLRGASFEKMNDTANRMGSWLASQIGGTPVVSKADLRRRLAELVPNRT
ncbi:MAG TPA: carbohydrate kinase [Terriglobales bacterium]|nr:carbohydrate kinase [Terriglobales bacterium]